MKAKKQVYLHIFAFPLLITLGLCSFGFHYFCSFEKTHQNYNLACNRWQWFWIFCDIFTTPIFLKQREGVGHIAVCNNETDCGNQLEFHKKENHWHTLN